MLAAPLVISASQLGVKSYGHYGKTQSKQQLRVGPDRTQLHRQGVWEKLQARKAQRSRRPAHEVVQPALALYKPAESIPVIHPPIRHERREEFFSHARSSYAHRTKATALLALMLLVPTAIAAIPIEQPGVFSAVYFPSSQFSYGSEDKTFGSCEKLHDNSTLCCSIQPHYTVTCCVYPSEAEYLRIMESCRYSAIPRQDCQSASQCISFDPSGIIGDPPESTHINITAAALEANNECAMAPDSRHIADEITDVLSKKMYFAHGYHESRNVTWSTFEPVDPTTKYELRELTTLLSEGSEASCVVLGTMIKRSDTLPKFYEMIQELAKKFHIPDEETSIMLFNDEMCHPRIKTAIGMRDTYISRHIFNNDYINIYASFMQGLSDKKQASVLAHEMHHIVQKVHWRKRPDGHNAEAEADLASVLATHSACIASYLSFEKFYRSFPTITRDNAVQRLVGQGANDPAHPSDVKRIAFTLTMNVLHKEALRRLIAQRMQTSQLIRLDNLS